jgi:two-component system, OmpR family, response regulator
MKTQSGSVLIIEESAALRTTFAECLEERGFKTFTARGVTDGRAILSSLKPDVAVIGVALEDGDGFDLIDDVVNIDSRCLVVALNDHSDDRIRALALGADDYIVQPVDLEEFFLRVRNILTHRRGQSVSADNPVLDLHGIRVNVVSRALVTGSGEMGPVLTETEFALLRMLAEHPDRIVSKDALFQGVYGRPYSASTRSLDVGVSRLRIKLKSADVGADIKSVRQVGYFLNRDGGEFRS